MADRCGSRRCAAADTPASLSVCDGATTIESPVWIPIGSMFSMLHTVMQLSRASRTTSYSISFQPCRHSSTSTCCEPPPKARVNAASISDPYSDDAASLPAQREAAAQHDRQPDPAYRRSRFFGRATCLAARCFDVDFGQALDKQIDDPRCRGWLRSACRAPELRASRIRPHHACARPQLSAV